MKKPTFGELLRDSEVPVLVDFHATWCGPCQAMNPVIKNLAGRLHDKVKVVKVDIDQNPQAAERFGVRGVPTFVLMKKGQEVWRQSGALPESMLEKAIMDHSN